MKKLKIVESYKNKIYHKRGTINTIVVKKQGTKTTTLLVP